MTQKAFADMSDEALVALVYDDQEVYAQLVSRYQDRLLRYIGYLLSDDELAQDVAQNTFLKAFQNLRGFDVNRSFKSWIYRIAHNEAINASKQQYRQRFVDKAEELLAYLPAKDDVEAEYDEKVDSAHLNQLLHLLPVKYREVIVLSIVDELPYKEISTVLRIPMGTVATRINRAKRKLIDLYQLHYGGERDATITA